MVVANSNVCNDTSNNISAKAEILLAQKSDYYQDSNTIIYNDCSLCLISFYNITVKTEMENLPNIIIDRTLCQFQQVMGFLVLDSI